MNPNHEEALFQLALGIKGSVLTIDNYTRPLRQAHHTLLQTQFALRGELDALPAVANSAEGAPVGCAPM